MAESGIKENREQILMENRNKVIFQTSLVGIGTNVLLAVFKAIVGIASNSIAVTLDAVNNLSDALSSVVTIIGAKLASRKPDKKHPLGHGRTEYISALVVAGIVLYAGITSFVESVKKILHPEEPEYSLVSLLIILTAVIVKILLGRFVKQRGEAVNSGSLIASGSDALFDAVLSGSVLVTAVIFMLTGKSFEAYVGVVIAVFIIKAGYEMISETVDEIVGHRADSEITQKIKALIAQDPDVYGVYDLIMHSYGPDRWLGSVHVSVYDTLDAAQIDTMTRRITERVYVETGVAMTAIGIYSINTKNDEIAEMRTRISEIVMKEEGVLQMHGFYVDEETHRGNFDLVIDFAVEDRDALIRKLADEVHAAFPEYLFHIQADIDAAD